MGIVFQSGIGEASPFARLGFFKGMICDEPYCIFRHLNLDTFSNDDTLIRVLLWVMIFIPLEASGLKF